MSRLDRSDRLARGLHFSDGRPPFRQTWLSQCTGGLATCDVVPLAPAVPDDKQRSLSSARPKQAAGSAIAPAPRGMRKTVPGRHAPGAPEAPGARACGADRVRRSQTSPRMTDVPVRLSPTPRTVKIHL